MSEQWHFEFKDWEEAFATFYRERCGEQVTDAAGHVLGFRKGDPNLVFVISTACDVSGYWIEPAGGAESNSEATVYRDVSAVNRLERRIRHERESTVNLSLGGVAHDLSSVSLSR